MTEDRVTPDEAEPVAPLVRRVVADNPGPFTYHGTCSYIVGQGQVAVIDPGPDDDKHVAALIGALDAGERVSHILVTHTHGDHSPAARALQAATGALTLGFGQQLRQVDPDTTQVHFGDPDVDPDPGKPLPPRTGDVLFEPDVLLRDGDVVDGDGWTLEAVYTPGHASNHLCYRVREDGSLFTGDHMMGCSTTVIGPPDGNLAEYMDSLDRLLEREGDLRYLPGHGPTINEPKAFVRAVVGHRRERDEQILDVLSGGPATIAEIVRQLYADTSKKLWLGAASSVYAHLQRLCAIGAVKPEDGETLHRADRVRLAAP